MNRALCKSCILTIFMLIFTANLFARANQKMRVAVLDLKPVGVSMDIAKTVTNMLRSDLINLNRFVVNERSQVDSILKEQGFQKAGCTDQECAIQIGMLISANKIFIGEVSSLGKAIIITVRIVDVEKGTSDYAAREKAASMETVDRAVSSLVEKLAERIDQKTKAASGPVTSSGYFLRGIVPGWGQFYADRNINGAIMLGGFIAAGGFATYALLDYSSKKSDYEGLKAGDDFKTAKDNYESAATLGNIALGIAAGVYLINWIDILFISKPDFSSSQAVNKEETPYYFSFDGGYYNPKNPELTIQMKASYRF